MAATATYTKAGNKATTTAKLDKTIFDNVPNNHELLKSAYVAYLANGRSAGATTKTRGEVRGGGKKPWRQKGTGRARFGSSRNPIWRSGGITFGPTGEQNYTHKLSTKATRQAIRQALSLAAKEGQVKVVETFTFAKTKDVATYLAKIEASGSILAVVANKDSGTDLATNNIPNLLVTSATYVNVYDVLNSDVVVITQDALKAINQWLGDKA
jgi:large subunit ribosomal protein L4